MSQDSEERLKLINDLIELEAILYDKIFPNAKFTQKMADIYYDWFFKQTTDFLRKRYNSFIDFLEPKNQDKIDLINKLVTANDYLHKITSLSNKNYTMFERQSAFMKYIHYTEKELMNKLEEAYRYMDELGYYSGSESD